jgi:hypothetical protein
LANSIDRVARRLGPPSDTGTPAPTRYRKRPGDGLGLVGRGAPNRPKAAIKQR